MRTLRFLVLALITFGLGAPAASGLGHAVRAPGASRATCTITGTSDSDHLVGTAGRDVICGGRGADHISAKGGDDLIFGGPGGDVVQAGKGDDLVDGGPGKDTEYGGNGADQLFGGKAPDRPLVGGRGADYVEGGPGSDSCLATRDGIQGNDRIVGGHGTDAYEADDGDLIRSAENAENCLGG